MRCLATSFLLLLAALFLTSTAAAASSHCQFVHGFKTYRDQIGHQHVGECLENERGVAHGTSQRTTRGILHWYRASNHIVFIPGPSATPVPAPAPTPRPQPTAAPAPTIDPKLAQAYHVMRRTKAGANIADRFASLGASATFEYVGNGDTSRWGSSPPRIIINEQYRNESPETLGLRLIWPTMWLHAYLESGGIDNWQDCVGLQTATQIMRIRYWSQMYGWNGKRNPAPETETWANEWLNVYQELGAKDDEISKWIYTMDWARDHCESYGDPDQHIDPDLAYAYRTAMWWDDDSELGSAAIVKLLYSGADVRFGTLPANVYGRYTPSNNLITINESLRGNDNVLAALLIHETHHAFTAAKRGYTWFDTAAACLQDEINAFKLEARWWYERYGRYGKRNPNKFERDYNNTLRAWLNDGMKERVLLSDNYQMQCLGGVVN